MNSGETDEKSGPASDVAAVEDELDAAAAVVGGLADENGDELFEPAEESDEDEHPVPEAREKFVVFLRHGIAEEGAPDQPDEERALTAEGHMKMKKIARAIEEIFPRARVIYTSPLVRATQTAAWVSKAYRNRIGVSTSDALQPGSGPEEVRELIREARERRIILVGHEPYLTRSMLVLTGMSTASLELKKGGVYGVRVDEEGRGRLEWLLPPRLLRRM